MNQKTLKTGFTQAAKMVRGYASEKILEQAGSVAFISIYMALFQFLVLGVPVAGAVESGRAYFSSFWGWRFSSKGWFWASCPSARRRVCVSPGRSP